MARSAPAALRRPPVTVLPAIEAMGSTPRKIACSTRCQVAPDHSNPVLVQPEIAQVKVRYKDELNGGAEQTVSGVARIQFTEDRNKALQSLRGDVSAQKELFLAAVAKEEPLADADAGRYQQAAQKLEREVKALDYKCQNAPAPMQSQLRQEIENLRFRSNQLQQNQYDAGTRKSLQSESWTVRNSK